MLFNKLKQFTLVLTTLLLVGCSSYQDFPVSDKAPGAEIKLAISKDKYDNNIIKIKTKYLVAPERLSPSKSFYVVWVKTKIQGTFNVGRLNTKTDKKSTLRTLTPFEPTEVFITAEEQPLLTVPKGIEICRIDLSNPQYEEAGK